MSNGSIVRYNSRLIERGYIQLEGIDYFDTFYTVTEIPTIRTHLTLASIAIFKVLP